MKKLIVLTFIFILLCGIMTAAVSATDGAASVTEPDVALKGASLALEDNVYIYFMMSNEVATADDWGVIFYLEDPGENASYEVATAEGSSAVVRSKGDGYAWTDPASGNVYYSFNYGVAAKQMTDVVYGQGYARVGDTYYCSSVVPYSAQIYAGNKLGIIDPNKKTQDSQLIELLERMLTYGSSSQKYFNYRLDDLADTILKWSTGLEFYSFGDGTCRLSDIGTCMDNEVYIPKFSPAGDRVVSVGTMAFYNWAGGDDNLDNVTGVHIPSGVTEIGDSAFGYCRALVNVSLPHGLTHIGSGAFDDTAFHDNFEGNALYCGTYLLAHRSGSEEHVTVREGTELIAESVFEYDTTITGITLQEGMIGIGKFAFRGCTSLQTISLPAGLTTIGSSAFRKCAVLNNVVLPRGLVSIGSSAFRECAGLTSITLPEGLVSIENYAFRGSALTSIAIPESVREIGYRAFYDCTELAALTLSQSLEHMGKQAFADTAYYSDDANWDMVDGERATLYIGNCLAEATTAAGKNVTIREGTRLICDRAFEACTTTLESVTLPASLKVIDDEAFCGCEKLGDTTLPSALTTIGDYAFENTLLTTLRIPASVTDIGVGAFVGTNLTTVELDAANRSYRMRNNSLIELRTKTLLMSFIGGTIPADIGITRIADYAFCYRDDLRSIVVPAGITHIGEGAFYECDSLETVELPVGIVELNYYTFYNCASLKSVKLPSTLKYMGEEEFYGCTSLKTIELPSGMNYLNTSLFENSGLESITIPNGVEEIGYYTFRGCTSLETVVIPNSVKFMNDSVFAGCTSLESITLPSGLTTVPSEAFMGCTSLKTVVLPDGLKYINDFAFKGCTALKSITLPDNFDDFYEGAFENSGLESIVIPRLVNSISPAAFAGCTALDTITLHEDVTLIYRDAFRGAHINTINLPNSLETIGSSAFEACSRADGSATVVNYAGTEAEWANVSKAPADATAGTNAWDHNANLTITFAPTT